MCEKNVVLKVQQNVVFLFLTADLIWVYNLHLCEWYGMPLFNLLISFRLIIFFKFLTEKLVIATEILIK